MKTSIRSVGCASLVLAFVACAKKEPKPLRTEPWLAHPPASVSSSAANDAGVPLVRYALTEQSVVRFELPSKHGGLRGSLTHVSGELGLDTGDFGRSQAHIDADLGSLTVQGSDGSSDAALRTRALGALELTDAGGPNAHATFELTALEDPVPPQLELATLAGSSDSGAAVTRHVRATALGTLLLHGFRVVRRAPIEAELGFTSDRATPSTVLIRSRAPFVISLETHAIRVLGPEGGGKSSARATQHTPEVRVSVELYGRKID